MDDSGVSYTDVTSSNVAAVGYDPDFRRLWVKFTNGSVYAYERVPPDVYLDFLRAPSKGKFLNRAVPSARTDSRYAYSQVE